MKSFYIEFGIEEVPAVAGRLDVYVEGDEVSVKVRFGVLQDPRFFEKFVKKRDPIEVPYMMSRICGVCSVVHLLCSTMAVEKAMDIKPEENSLKIREIAKGMEILQNNLVHVLMSIPDFTSTKNALDFSKKYPNIFSKIMELNARTLDIYRRVGGRFVHTPNIGAAFHGKPIYRYELEGISKELSNLSEELHSLTYELAEIWKPLAPGFKEPIPTYCVLQANNGYPFFSEQLLFSDGQVVSAEKYHETIEELKIEYSNAHYTLYKGKPFYTGSRARLQAYSHLLTDRTREVVKLLKIDYDNPFENVKAQYAEAVQVTEVIAQIAAELAAKVKHSIKPFYLERRKDCAGEGIAFATAPRGTLIHHYRIRDGKMDYANVITPTVMNARHVEVNGESLIRWLVSSGQTDEEEVKPLIAALLRAYDPCLPCAVH
ncbi:MAG TPA: hypothetical protein ENJ59_00605 [Thermofilum sp.]|nr:hypothetical protein [Thermofilum sp.]